VSESDIHANFFQIVARKGKSLAFVVPVNRRQVRGGKWWWLALRYNLDSGAYLVKGIVVTEVAKADVSMDIEAHETSDGRRASDWIFLRGGFRRS
jgi:hypothetical protein